MSVVDASIVRTKEQRLDARARAGLQVLLSLPLLLTILLGGRIGGVPQAATAILVLLVLCLRALGVLTRSRSTLERQLIPLFAGLVLLVALQLVPLPVSVFGFLLSSTATDRYFETISIDPGQTWTGLVWLIGVVLFFYIGVHSSIDNRTVRRMVLISVVGTGILASLIALLHKFLGITSYFSQVSLLRLETRAHYPFTNPNHLAVLMEMSIPALICLSRNSWRGRLFGLPALLLMVATLFLTASRTGIALVLGFLALGSGCWLVSRYTSRVRHTLRKRADRVEQLRMRLRSVLVIGTSIAVLSILVLLLVGEQAKTLLEARVSQGFSEGIDQVRRSLLAGTVAAVLSTPMLGVGFGCWHLKVAAFLSVDIAGWTLDFAHNDFLQLLVELGIVGGALVVIAFVAVVRNLPWKGVQDVRYLDLFLLSSALAMPLLHSILDFPFHVPSLVLTFMTVLFAVTRMLDDANDANNDVQVTVHGVGIVRT